MKIKPIERLQSLQTLKKIPQSELDWLVAHGKFEVYQAGLILPKGSKIENLWIILDGSVGVRIDRGAGPKKVNTELNQGAVTGFLPYSRMIDLPGDLYADQKTEVFSLSIKHFPEMVYKCPKFTALTVHTMIDRTRIHNTSAMQDEKMISMGKMAAGLAHELNNPASVAIRDAKLLRKIQDDADKTLLALIKAGINDEQLNELDKIRYKSIENVQKTSFSAIQKYEREDEISDWLEKNNINTEFAYELADFGIAENDLDKLLDIVPGKHVEKALHRIITSCSLYRISLEIEQSTRQIYQLVEAIKKFTHMDNLAEKELVDIESGLNDSLRVLEAKTKSKNAKITMEIDKNLPAVYANGAALNQVWFSLLDNALDAIPDSGKIDVRVNTETDFVVVRITDNGHGIPGDKISRIFDPFYTTKPPGQGTGLGLDLSRRLVRCYNGDIYARSESGRTEFCVNLNTVL